MGVHNMHCRDPNQGGDPAGQVTLDPWPVYTVATQTHLQLDTGTMLTNQYLRVEFCAFRSELIPELTGCTIIKIKIFIHQYNNNRVHDMDILCCSRPILA